MAIVWYEWREDFMNYDKFVRMTIECIGWYEWRQCGMNDNFFHYLREVGMNDESMV